MKVVLFIPIKLNSQRLPGKNIMLLNGKPLCEYIFDTVKNIKEIDERYVYCSDKAIIPYIPDGLKFLKRDTRLDKNETKGLEIIESFVNDVDADIYIITHTTQPFTKVSSIAQALEKVVSGKHDCAITHNTSSYFESMYYNIIPLRWGVGENMDFEGLDDKFYDKEGLKKLIAKYQQMSEEDLNNRISALLKNSYGVGVNRYKELIK